MKSSVRPATLGEILLVDDDPMVRKPIAKFLVESGYVVTEAFDGRDAIDMVRIGFSKPLAVVLDVDMPRLDGPGFLRELVTSPVPAVTANNVILVSGSQEVAKIATEFRVPRYFVKPVSTRTLLQAIGTLHQGQ